MGTFADFYTGAGGFTEGMKQAGHECVLAVDNWETALNSHEKNHPEAEHWNKDVLKIRAQDIPKVDFIIGSPPCQQLSSANRSAPKNPDLSSIRHFLKLGKNFDFYIGENVQRVAKYLNGTHKQFLRANNFGLWHLRERCFFGKFPHVRILTRNPTYFPTPLASNHKTAKQISLTLHSATRPKHKRKNHRCQVAYPWYVSRWMMGFPDKYTFIGTIEEREQQIGNAVCPPVAKAIGEALMEGLP